jgi:predicted PurR-regulated permease PerM
MKTTLQNIEVKNIFFLIALVLFAVVAFTMFAPYMNIIIISLVIVQIFHPFYRWILSKSKSTAFSTFLSILITLLFVLIPFVLIFILTFNEIKNISEANNILKILEDLGKSLNDTIDNINNLLKNLNADITLSRLNLRDFALTLAAGLRTELLPITTKILSLSGEILFNLFLLLLCLIYFFPMYDKLPQIISKVSPLDDEIDLALFQKFRETTKGVIKGSLVVAVLQATAVLLPLLMLRIGAPILLWIIMVILSIIPVGSGLVWAPIGFAFIIDGVRTGNATQVIIGVLVMVYSAFIINVIDTTFRPRLMKGTVNIHPLAAIFSVLGGLYMFGPLGLLYGPLIFVLFISIMDIYNKKFLNKDKKGETIETA